jgi:hypothetical protein
MQELWEATTLLLDNAKPSIKWLFVSQPTIVIQNMLAEYPLVKVEIRSSVVDQDIRSYVGRRLETDLRLRSFPRSVKVKIIQVIGEKSSGM